MRASYKLLLARDTSKKTDVRAPITQLIINAPHGGNGAPSMRAPRSITHSRREWLHSIYTYIYPAISRHHRESYYYFFHEKEDDEIDKSKAEMCAEEFFPEYIIMNCRLFFFYCSS